MQTEKSQQLFNVLFQSLESIPMVA